MTFGSVKSLMRVIDTDFLKVDGASETARFFVSADRKIEIAPRGVTVTRRISKPRSRLRRFVRIS
ncbi:hypothetical protein E8L99_04030 [Phreatobacter aquaticus]|jgi:hypothetical protein|uniref:Uncharacterized protein n=1 Tax=Phreatobacter aquaticus TaxID=2570229 RepID=A0A4D7QH44_9HYPH|nr:hypothetical protein [Phreatobacter aquaticus]QCK85003.1 hypothetical protein E8L99_04030 [Phreatobacter aquaticus]